MDIATLRAERSQQIVKMTSINAKAADEKRIALTDAEQADFSASEARVNEIDAAIKRAETLGGLTKPDAMDLRAGGKDLGKSGEIGLTAREAKSFSVVKLMRHLLDPTNMAARNDAGFEIEASRAAGKHWQDMGADVRGATIPVDVLRAPSANEQRAQSAGTASAGGNLVATELLAGSFIEVLRNRVSVTAMGATMLDGLIGNVAIPRATSANTISWVSEGSAPGSASSVAFDQVPLYPSTAACYTDVTRRLLLQSAINVEAFVRNDLIRQIALAIDYAALNGSGSGGQPLGIMQTSGIGSVALGTNGYAPTWAGVVALESTVAAANADIGTLGYLTNAKGRGALKSVPKLGNTTALPIWDNNEVNGYQAMASNQVPSNLTKGTGTGLSALLFGNWADLIIGMWGGLDLLVDPYSSSTTGTVRFIALQDIGVALRHLTSFAAITDMVA